MSRRVDGGSVGRPVSRNVTIRKFLVDEPRSDTTRGSCVSVHSMSVQDPQVVVLIVHLRVPCHFFRGIPLESSSSHPICLEMWCTVI